MAKFDDGKTEQILTQERKTKMDFVPNTMLMGTATMEELSSTLAEQVNDQDRYALAETIIVAQVTLCDKLVEEQQTMIEKIRGLEEKMTAP